MKKNTRDAAISAGMVASMGALIPLADLPTLVEVVGPLAAAVWWQAQSIVRHPYIPVVHNDGVSKVTVSIERRMFQPFTKLQRQQDMSYREFVERRDSGRYYAYHDAEDALPRSDATRINVGTVDLNEADGKHDPDELLAELIAQTKTMIENWTSGPSEIAQKTKRTAKLLSK